RPGWSRGSRRREQRAWRRRRERGQARRDPREPRAPSGRPLSPAGPGAASPRGRRSGAPCTADVARGAPVSRALHYARANARIPLQQRRVLAQDRLVALRAGGDQTERNADQLLEPLEIVARLRGQVGLVLRAGGGRHPAFDVLVDGLELRQRRPLPGDGGDDVAAPAIARADLERLALIEHVELG